MTTSVENFALLLLIAGVVAILTRRFRIPYSVGLVAAGIVLAAVPYFPDVNLTKELLFTGLLPPLIFEAAFTLDWRELRRNFWLVLVLATLGVVFSAAVTAFGMHRFASWSWISALTFGVLIAATDPVSVVATFREARAKGRLLALVEGESLFNDATAAVFFAIVLEMAEGHAPTAVEVAWQFILSVGGSLICGAAVAGVALLLAGKATDHLAEITFTTVAAYGSFLLAEHFHFSGVLATLTTGIMIGNGGRFQFTERGKEAVQAFWEYAAFVANSLVFLLIGMHEARQNLLGGLKSVGLAILLVTISRAAAVYPCCALFMGSRLRVPARYQLVLFWGGLRGGLALALALALPAGFPQRESIVTLSFAVVAFSVFVQGLSLTPLLRSFGEIPEKS